MSDNVVPDLEPPDLEPSEFRLVRSLALAPSAAAVSVAGACICLIWGAYYASGVPLIAQSPGATWSISPQAHAGLLASVLLGYSVGATAYMARTGRLWQARHIRQSRWGGATALMIGVLVSVLAIESIRALEPDRPLLIAGEVMLNLVFLLLFWAVGRAGYFAVLSVIRPETVEAVNLFDLRPLYRHGRDQLRSAMIWLIGISILLFVMLFDPNPAVRADSTKVVAPMLAGYILLAITMILLPLRQIWISIRSAKEIELDAVMVELRAMRAASNVPVGREADLLSRHHYISKLSEWPFDAASVGTFAFYVLLPFLTWAAATFAKRLFDTVLIEKVISVVARMFLR